MTLTLYGQQDAKKSSYQLTLTLYGQQDVKKSSYQLTLTLYGQQNVKIQLIANSDSAWSTGR